MLYRSTLRLTHLRVFPARRIVYKRGKCYGNFVRRCVCRSVRHHTWVTGYPLSATECIAKFYHSRMAKALSFSHTKDIGEFFSGRQIRVV